jgi:hypothetical protein
MTGAARLAAVLFLCAGLTVVRPNDTSAFNDVVAQRLTENELSDFS